MKVSVRSRIHRILRGLKPFTKCSNWEDLGYFDAVGPALDPGEALLGVYENTPGSALDLVAFTTLGVHFNKASGWCSIKYRDIGATVWPEESKQEARSLTLRLQNGALECIAIRRGYLFDVMRFFDRVVKDVRQQGGGA